MYRYQKIKMLLACCLLACTSLWAQDRKIEIFSAEASVSQSGEEAYRVIDGESSTLWHSPYYSTSFPVEITITFNPETHVDYVRYVPRTSGDNGNWQNVDVAYCATAGGEDFISVGNFDLNGASTAYNFYLPNVDKCGQVRFTINSGQGGWASASEIEAYVFDTEKNDIFAEYFLDELCLKLKPEITSSDGIDDKEVKALVESLLYNAEDYKRFRVAEYEPYMTLATLQHRLKTSNPYNAYENPTGIYLERGESCWVAVTGIEEEYPVGLKIKNWLEDESVSYYQLRNGLNYIKATTEGNVFVNYYTDDFKTAPNVKVHFINAPVLGYWDQKTMTNEDWINLLADKRADDNRIIITRSEHAQLAFPISSWLIHCPDNVNATMTHFQDVQRSLRNLMGLDKYNYNVKNRQLYYVSNYGFMAATGDGAYCNVNSIDGVMTPDASKFDFINVGHEWGHNNQITPGFKWSGCGEVTNHLFAIWTQIQITGDKWLVLEDRIKGIEEYSDMRGGYMQPYFEEAVRKGVPWQLQEGSDYYKMTPSETMVRRQDADGNEYEMITVTYRNYDHSVKLVPFWQLILWGTLAEKCPDIIPMVLHSIRTTDNYGDIYNTNGKQQVNWMKLACDSAKIDLLPFFEKAGMLRPIHAYIEDYYKGWNIISEKMIDELKSHVKAQGYPSFTEEINYINGHNYHIYRDNLKLNVSDMQGVRNGDKVIIQHSVARNAVAFETYNAQDELIRITMYGLGSDDDHSYTQVLFPENLDKTQNASYIMAVGYDGERQKVYQRYSSEDDADEQELGRILSGIEVFLQFEDATNTKVGYYKTESLTELKSAYNVAKGIYDNKVSASFVSAYDMLYSEYVKVKNDDYARIDIVQGNAYRLENKQYSGRWMSVNDDFEMLAEIFADTDAQKWYFEESETKGRYYIKNKHLSTYPGDVETSKVLSVNKTNKAEAHAYQLQDMGNGLWALVGGTGLHCGGYNYAYKVVGWEADEDATQWRITAVEIDENAEMLHNLKTLIEKVEDLVLQLNEDNEYAAEGLKELISSTEIQLDDARVVCNTINPSKNELEPVYNSLNSQYELLLEYYEDGENESLIAKKAELLELMDVTNRLIISCGTIHNSSGSYTVELKPEAGGATEELVLAVYKQIQEAQMVSNYATMESQVQDAIDKLQALKDLLAFAIKLPVRLTTDASSPKLYAIKTNRNGNPVLQYDMATGMFSVTPAVENTPSQAFYFMKGDGENVYIYPYIAEGKVLATNDVNDGHSKVTAMVKGTAAYEQWIFVEQAGGCYNLQPMGASTYLSNYGGESNMMGFYSLNPSTDAGSLLSFEEMTMEGSYVYLKLKNFYSTGVKVSGTIQGSTAVGYYPVVQADAYNTAYNAAAEILAGTTATDKAYQAVYDALVTANDALVMNMPEEGRCYRLVSVVKGDGTNAWVYANPTDSKVYWSEERLADEATAVWSIAPSGTEGVFNICNLHTGTYISQFIYNVSSALSETAHNVDIVSLSGDGQVGFKCNGAMMHAQSGGAVVRWETSANDASAWRIEEVDMSEIKHTVSIGEYELAGLFLNYPTVIPNGVKAFFVEEAGVSIDADGIGRLSLTKIEGNVLPAKTAVILSAPQGVYDFYYTNETTKSDFSTNLLEGSAYQKYLEADVNRHPHMLGSKDGIVGLYKDDVMYGPTGGEGTTHHKVSANDVYLGWNADVVVWFRIDDQTTNVANAIVEKNSVVYDLYGRRIVKVVASGLYIVDGQKQYILVK